MKRLLVQTQLSNYDSKGRFILECDSGWQMVMGRVREMLRLVPDLHVTVMGPSMDEGREQCVTHPVDINPDLWERYGHEGEDRLAYFGHRIISNALVTRYDFDWTGLACGLDLGMQKVNQAPRYDAVYVNDPMHLRNLKAMFHVVGGYQPRFYVHSHFIDSPSCPKFPKEASMWLGQCEAAIRADHNFWQCRSSMEEFFRELGSFFAPDVVRFVKQKSDPWDDGYSRAEIRSDVDYENMRFTSQQWEAATAGKHVVFFPNRISPSSGDYTNGMKFMFELLPQLRQRRQDFVVVCGNPNQKFTNAELSQRCGAHGYVSLVPDSLNRDEFRWIASHSDVALGLYDKDAYGGTASRECVELECMPLWLDINEYASLAREALVHREVLVNPDFSDLGDKLFGLFDLQDGRTATHPSNFDQILHDLRKVVQSRCSYEATSRAALSKMGLL